MPQFGRWFLLMVAAGSSVPEVVAQQSPILRPLTRVKVAESDTFLLGRVAGASVGPRGQYLLIDGAEARVLELNPQGQLTRAFGRPGAGPGELRMPTALAISGDTLLSVLDFGQRRVMHWNLQTGAVRGSFPLMGRITQLQYRGRELRIGLLDPQSSAAVHVVSPTGERGRGEGRRPQLFEQSPPLLAAFGAVFFADDGEDTYAVFEVSNSLHHWRRGAIVADQTPLPIVARKGVRVELFDALLRDPGQAATLAYDRSIPYALQRLGPGLLALVTVDATLGKTDLIGSFHVSVLDLVQRRGCMDALVPAAQDPLPSVAFAGDTLVVVQQGEDAGGEPATWIQRYRIDVSGCRWLALAPAVPVRP